MTKDWLERILSDQERAEEEEWQQFYAQFQRDAQRWHDNLTGKVEKWSEAEMWSKLLELGMSEETQVK